MQKKKIPVRQKFSPSKNFPCSPLLTINHSSLQNLSELCSYLIYFRPPNIFQYEISFYHARDTARPRAKFIKIFFRPSNSSLKIFLLDKKDFMIHVRIVQSQKKDFCFSVRPRTYLSYREVNRSWLNLSASTFFL